MFLYYHQEKVLGSLVLPQALLMEKLIYENNDIWRKELKMTFETETPLKISLKSGLRTLTVVRTFSLHS